MQWKIFEEECLKYLNGKYGNYFKLQGKSNSTVSDIYFNGEGNSFYIEAKMPTAQCGQFVLLPSVENKKLTYSNKNKTQQNEFSDEIIKFINLNVDKFLNCGTAGIEILLNKDIFYKWIVNYYKNKNVKYIITKQENFLIFSIDKINKYFDITARYRQKKSGSRALNSSKTDFEFAMRAAGIDFTFVGHNIVSNEDLDSKKIKGLKYVYLIKKSKIGYVARILSNTKNASVIFLIKLKKYNSEEQKNDILNFEKDISR